MPATPPMAVPLWSVETEVPRTVLVSVPVTVIYTVEGAQASVWEAAAMVNGTAER